MNKENCALKLVDEIILYYDALSKKHKKNIKSCQAKAPQYNDIRTLPTSFYNLDVCLLRGTS